MIMRTKADKLLSIAAMLLQDKKFLNPSTKTFTLLKFLPTVLF